MSIRTKIALVLVGAVILPLAISMVFWTLILRSTVGAEIGFWALFGGRQQREARINSAFKAFSGTVTKRSAAATGRVADAAKQLSRGITDLSGHLERLGCARSAPPPACEAALRAFLERFDGDLQGVSLRVGESTRDVLQPGVVGERAAATAATLASLEREPGDLTLRPAALDSGWLIVTRRATGAGRITA